MKVLIVDGTPEEISTLNELTAFLQNGQTVIKSASPESDLSGGISPEVKAFVASKAGKHAQRHHLVEMYLERVVDLGGVEFELGTSTRTKDGLNHYLMIRDSGPRRFGAVAYVRPSTAGVNVRLPASAAQGFQHARPRNLSNPDRAYQVMCHLRSEAAVEEAVQLTEKALEEVRRNDDNGKGRG